MERHNTSDRYCIHFVGGLDRHIHHSSKSFNDLPGSFYCYSTRTLLGLVGDLPSLYRSFLTDQHVDLESFQTIRRKINRNSPLMSEGVTTLFSGGGCLTVVGYGRRTRLYLCDDTRFKLLERRVKNFINDG